MVNSVPYHFVEPAHTSAFINFDQALASGFTLSGGLIQDVSNGQGAEPGMDPGVYETSDYLAANPGDPATLTSTSGYRAVSLYWGSIDAYNTITLLGRDGQAIGSFTGSQIIADADGNQLSGATNRRVTFRVTGATAPIYGLEFQSSEPAFEVDNIAFLAPVRDCRDVLGAVPEPASWAMMIGGLGMLGGLLRGGRKLGAFEILAA